MRNSDYVFTQYLILHNELQAVRSVLLTRLVIKHHYLVYQVTAITNDEELKGIPYVFLNLIMYISPTFRTYYDQIMKIVLEIYKQV